jgi:hypothetical protein
LAAGRVRAGLLCFILRMYRAATSRRPSHLLPAIGFLPSGAKHAPSRKYCGPICRSVARKAILFSVPFSARRADVFQLAIVWTSSDQPADWPHPLIAHKTRISFNEEAKANPRVVQRSGVARSVNAHPIRQVLSNA